MSAWTAVLGNAEARCRISYRLSDPNAAAIEAVADGRGARPHISIGYPCSVFPLRSSRACGSKPAITSKDSTAPAGLPGRFKISVLLRTPHTPRLRAANGVFFPPSARMRSAMPSSSFSQTAFVASGVTSRAAIPVPPVVTISGTSRARRISRFCIWITSSETTSRAATEKWSFSSN